MLAGSSAAGVLRGAKGGCLVSPRSGSSHKGRKWTILGLLAKKSFFSRKSIDPSRHVSTRRADALYGRARCPGDPQWLLTDYPGGL